MEHAVVINFDGSDFFARRKPKRSFQLHLNNISEDEIRRMTDEDLFVLFRDNHELFEVKRRGAVMKLTPMPTYCDENCIIDSGMIFYPEQDYDSLVFDLLQIAEASHYFGQSFDALRQFREHLLVKEAGVTSGDNPSPLLELVRLSKTMLMREATC